MRSPQRPDRYEKVPDTGDLSQIPMEANQVTDLDEEVVRRLYILRIKRLLVGLLIVHSLAKPQTEARRGLGYVDSCSPVLDVKSNEALILISPLS